jgi:chemotaxis protein MotB
MAQKSKPPEKGGEVGSPLWMISFTDAMTNLLTFFILLVTFAAFGDRDKNMGHATGYGPRTAGASVSPNQAPSRPGAIASPPLTSQVTPAGSEKPNPSLEPDADLRPRAPIGILDTEVYHDRKVIYLPSKFVFYGWGKFITEAGQIRLAQIAPLLRDTTCQIVVGETSYLHPNHPMFARQNIGPQRAWAIIQYFTEKEGIAADRFNLAAQPMPAQADLNEEPVVELTLFARRVFP